ncbi:MAG: PorV/PorQ family protein [Saprospiraceae bacterium]|nr:PorV/PorQ family protein [Saprospiraceae bacterium]
MKHIFIIFCLMAGYCSQVYSQKFVNEFLNIGVGARAHGMFGSVVANVNDGTAAYWNTAGLTELASPLQINVMHAKWFGGIANYDYVSIAKQLNSKNKSVAAFSFIRLGVDNIPNTLNLIGPDGTVDYNRITNFSASDYGGIFSYARTMGSSEKFSLGGNVKIIHRSIGAFGKAWGFGADLGAKWKSGNLTIGATIRDITTTFNAWSFNLTEEEKKVFQSTGNDIPLSSTEITLPRLIIGSAYSLDKGNFTYLMELDLNISTNGTKAGVLSGKNLNVDPSLGFEVGYYRKVYLRAGLGNMQSIVNQVNTAETDFEIQPNVGLGLKLGRLKLDYALANIGSVSGILVSHIFSLGLDFVPGSSK